MFTFKKLVPRQIIINADDFGLSNSVNMGIIQLIAQGIVTSTSLFLNLPGFELGLAIAKSLPQLSVGIHLNLTYGSPLLPLSVVPSLADAQGKFVNKKWVLWHGKSEDMEREFRAQIERFLATGIPPTHLNTHHNLHEDLRVLEIIIPLLKEYKIPALRRLHPDILASQGIATTDYCIQKEFWRDNNPRHFKSMLKGLPSGVTELVCHPGYVDQATQAISPWTWQREKELAFFTNKKTLKIIKDCGAQLISFHQFNR